MIVIAIFIAVVIKAAGEIDLVTDQTQHIDPGGLDATAGLGSQFPTHLAEAHEEKDAVELFTEQDRVGQHQAGRSVPKNDVVARQLANAVDYLLTAAGIEQLGGVGGLGAGGNDIEVVLNVLNQGAGVDAGIGEQARKALPLLHPEVAALHRQAHVGVDDQHPQTEVGQGTGKDGDRCGLALPLGGGGDAHKTDVPVGPQQTERGEQAAQRFLDREALAGRHLGGAGGNLHTRLQGQVGNQAEHRQLQLLLRLHRRVENVVGALAQDRRAQTRQQAHHGSPQQVALDVGLHRHIAKFGGGNDLPGGGGAGEFETDSLAGLHIGSVLLAGPGKAGLQVFVSAQLLGAVAEIFIEQQDLAVDLILLGDIRQEFSTLAIEGLLAHHRAQLVATCQEGLDHRRILAVRTAGQGQLLLQAVDLLGWAWGPYSGFSTGTAAGNHQAVATQLLQGSRSAAGVVLQRSGFNRLQLAGQLHLLGLQKAEIGDKALAGRENGGGGGFRVKEVVLLAEAKHLLLKLFHPRHDLRTLTAQELDGGIEGSLPLRKRKAGVVLGEGVQDRPSLGRIAPAQGDVENIFHFRRSGGDRQVADHLGHADPLPLSHRADQQGATQQDNQARDVGFDVVASNALQGTGIREGGGFLKGIGDLHLEAALVDRREDALPQCVHRQGASDQRRGEQEQTLTPLDGAHQAGQAPAAIVRSEGGELGGSL